MGVIHGPLPPTYIKDGLTFNIDCLDTNSYPGTGTVWTSTVNATNIGTMSGVTFDGTSMYFDGLNDDYVDFVTTSNSITSDPFTIECWFKATTSLHDVMFANSAENGGGLVIKNQDSRIYLFGTSSGLAYKESYLSTGNWYQLVITIDGTTVSFWRNGVNVGTDGTPNGSPAYVVSSTDPFRVGYAPAGGIYDFQGNIDIVRMYDRVLTAPEVLNNFNVEKDRFGL
jgi:hypothetical protein